MNQSFIHHNNHEERDKLFEIDYDVHGYVKDEIADGCEEFMQKDHPQVRAKKKVFFPSGFWNSHEDHHGNCHEYNANLDENCEPECWTSFHVEVR
jgi:hypothetical protein